MAVGGLQSVISIYLDRGQMEERCSNLQDAVAPHKAAFNKLIKSLKGFYEKTDECLKCHP